MELLSFTYVVIELFLLGITIWGLVVSWWSVLIGLVGFAFYPIFYEVFLAIFFRIKFALNSSKKAHEQRHINQQRTNGLLYHPLYNLSFLKWKEVKGFDLNRSENVVDQLLNLRSEENFAFTYQFNEPDYAVIYKFCSVTQLIFLNYSAYLSYVFDQMWFLVPGVMLRVALLRKYLHQVQGTINGVCVAIEKGCAINLGGGFHHASLNSSSGLCPYNDIGIAIQYLWHFHPEMRNVLVIDLDAHQGNGHARDKARLAPYSGNSSAVDAQLLKKRIFILDMFNEALPFPKDAKAREFVDLFVSVGKTDSDERYLDKLRDALERTRATFSAHFIIYNSGTDCVFGDPVGCMGLSPQAIKMRDEMVFNYAREQKAPVLMLLSGGLTSASSPVIANSIINLNEKFDGLKYNAARFRAVN